MRKLVGIAAFLIVALTALPLPPKSARRETRRAARQRNFAITSGPITPKPNTWRPCATACVSLSPSTRPRTPRRRYPIWMTRTPYTVAPYGADNYRTTLGPSEFFARDGYIFAYCDVRGQGKSEGTFVHVRPYIPNKT